MSLIKLSEVMSLYGVEEVSGDVTLDCPVCRRPNRLNVNFDVNNGIGAFRCPACAYSHGTQGKSPFTLYGILEHGLIPSEINEHQRQQLRTELNEKLNKGKVIKEIKTTNHTNPYLAKPADEQTIHIAYKTLLDNLVLYDYHFNHLVKRGLKEQHIIEHNYKSFPYTQEEKEELEIKLNESGITLKGVAGFYFDKGMWRIKDMPNGFLVPHKALNGLYNGMQLRVDDNSLDAKYLWLYSSNEYLGARASAVNHVVGEIGKEIIITEGGLKANVINALSGLPVVSIAGITTFGKLEEIVLELKDEGVEKFYTAVDMDWHTNPNVRAGRERLHKLLSKLNVNWIALDWSENSNSNGLDDFLFDYTYYVKNEEMEKLRHKLNNNEVNPCKGYNDLV